MYAQKAYIKRTSSSLLFLCCFLCLFLCQSLHLLTSPYFLKRHKAFLTRQNQRFRVQPNFICFASKNLPSVNFYDNYLLDSHVFKCFRFEIFLKSQKFIFSSGKIIFSKDHFLKIFFFRKITKNALIPGLNFRGVSLKCFTAFQRNPAIFNKKKI